MQSGNGSMPVSAAAPQSASRATTVALVVPTRNEATHIESFLERVEAALGSLGIRWHAEIIDNSDDETASILRELSDQGAPVEVTHQDDAGGAAALGSAVRIGLGRARGDIVCVVDADLQHPPEILPELLAPIILGRADICVGSRYRGGGSAAGLEGRWRRLAARASGVAVRWVLPATSLTSDPGSGLFALRSELLDGVTLRPRGSRVLAEVLTRVSWRTTCDVPYRFAHTAGGTAGLGISDAASVARELATLWRWGAWLGALRDDRSGRSCDPPRGRRRVAPVHVELLRHSTACDGTLSSVRSLSIG